MMGLITRHRMPRNLIPNHYGLMTVDTDSDGVVDGFTKYDSHTGSVFVLDGGQKITLANVTSTVGFSQVRIANVPVSPSVTYALLVDAALVRSGAEVLDLRIRWYTVGDEYISEDILTGLNPGTSYARQKFVVASPGTAAKAELRFSIFAKAIDATGSAWFRDAIFRKAR